MNPCWKISLLEGARYIAIADFIYSALCILVVVIQLISISVGGVEALNPNVTSARPTSHTEILVSYFSIGLVNLVLAIVLHRGIAADDLQKCRTFLVISALSTFFGFLIVTYHGLHLQQLPISLFNSEFFISILYHIYKLYALFVIVCFVIELQELIKVEHSAMGGRKKRMQYQSLDSHPDDNNQETAEIVKFVFFDIPFSAKHVIEEDQFTIDYENCLEFEEITSTLSGTLKQMLGKRDVAVKMLKSNFRMEKHMKSLVKEAKLLFYIGNHQHIVQLLGLCCTSGDNVRGNAILIMERFPPKRLDAFLRDSYQNELQNFVNLVGHGTHLSRKARRLGTVYENYETDYFQMEPFSTINMIQWAYQLSSAMDYLHSKKVIYGNLQAKSLLLIAVSQVKLIDFTFASELWENAVIPSSQLSGKVSWQWTAVECLQAANQGYLIGFNEKTDSWSFGTTLMEIFNVGQVAHVTNLPDFINALAEGWRPEKPQYASDGIYNMMKNCWSENPSDRPTFNVMTLFFRQILSSSIQQLD